MSNQTNHIPPFEFGRYSVEAWGHRSSTGVGAVEMIWSIRVDDVLLGSFAAPLESCGDRDRKAYQAPDQPEPSEVTIGDSVISAVRAQDRWLSAGPGLSTAMP